MLRNAVMYFISCSNVILIHMVTGEQCLTKGSNIVLVNKPSIIILIKEKPEDRELIVQKKFVCNTVSP